MGAATLIIGGSGFIGWWVTEACLARGHEVTVFNRAVTDTALPPQVERITGDRAHPTPDTLRALTRCWDHVIDTCAHRARDVAPAWPALTSRVGRYLLLSTCGVYLRPTPTATVPDEDAATMDEADQPLDRSQALGKLTCESLITTWFPSTVVVRLGVVTGPGDPSGRLTYWIDRCLRGGDVLVPAEPQQPVQLIDVRDVAGFLTTLLDAPVRGVVNVAGPVLRFDELITGVNTAAGGLGQLRWLPEAHALGHQIRPWQQVPLWLPAGSPERALMRVTTTRATDLGLSCRPTGATIADTTTWYRANRHWRDTWLSLRTERTILAAAR